jgi:leucyl aminopeptidase
MSDARQSVGASTPADVLRGFDHEGASRPIWLVRDPSDPALGALSPEQRAWLAATGFQPQPKRYVILPGAGESGEPCGPGVLLVGQLPALLPPGTYHLGGAVETPELAAIAWALGAYRFRRYKSADGDAPPVLKLAPAVDRARVLAIAEGVWLGRDLINTPASDMGPAELEAAARDLGARHGAEISVVSGHDLLERNFPLIHAVGRASTRAPRLIDLSWGRQTSPRVTLVGKGICFDTGGLDIKPASGMLLMKKDMGGAATALALGHMIMALSLDVRLRILIPAAENSISGNAFRPQDVIRARSGQTVEIGNTDAEGRLVLADALSLADEESPDLLLTFSTLTGAARAALGPDLPPLYTDDDALASDITAAGIGVGDPVWRMPFWAGYERMLDSEVADMGNVSESPFAGSIVAALFLRRFVRRARRFAHFDIYGWRPAARPLGPKGGEPQGARAVLEVLRQRYSTAKGGGRRGD